jgi:hypothetical protein
VMTFVYDVLESPLPLRTRLLEPLARPVGANDDMEPEWFDVSGYRHSEPSPSWPSFASRALEGLGEGSRGGAGLSASFVTMCSRNPFLSISSAFAGPSSPWEKRTTRGEVSVSIFAWDE